MLGNEESLIEVSAEHDVLSVAGCITKVYNTNVTTIVLVIEECA